MDTTSIDLAKTTIEKHIITVLDYLLLDDKITTDEVVEISKEVLNKFDQANTKHELYESFYSLLNLHPVLDPYLNTNLKGLNQFLNGT